MPALAAGPRRRRRIARGAALRAPLGLIERWRAIEARTRAASERAGPLFDKRGQLLPRERVAPPARPRHALPELSHAGRLAAGQRRPGDVGAGRRHRSPASASSRGVRVHGRRRATPASTPARIQPMGLDKLLRAQEIALREQAAVRAPGRSGRRQPAALPGGEFVHGGALFRNLARLSAAGMPVITRACTARRTAGGAYMPGLCDDVIMVRGRVARLPRRPAAAEGRDRRGRDRRGARRRRDARRGLRPGRVPGRGRRGRRWRIARELVGCARLAARAPPGPTDPSRSLPTPTTCSACSPPTCAKPSTCAR